MKKIAVFTSGGDAPGMNACVRAVVRTAIYHNLEVSGIRRGYEGMINGDFISLGLNSVANIIQRGGTFLKTARSQEFMTKEGDKRPLIIYKNRTLKDLYVLEVTEASQEQKFFMKSMVFPP